MNELIASILRDPNYIEQIRNKLPPAFEMVGQQAQGPEVGTLREAVLLGMFIAFLGEANVTPSSRAVEPDIDCHIGIMPLSIKTVTGGAGIRIKWTANAVRANEFMETYSPRSDLLIIRIVWDGDGYISYIPLEVQQRAFSRLGSQYLDYRGATNTRGVNISQAGLNIFGQDRSTITLPLRWFRSIQPQTAYERWVNYWRDP